MVGQCGVHAGLELTNVPLPPFFPFQVAKSAAVGISATARPQGTCTGLGQKPNPVVWEISHICGTLKRHPGSSRPYLRAQWGYHRPRLHLQMCG